MASQRSTNTMAEFLQKMLGDIAMAKTLPDADLQFLVTIETAILQKMRQPVDALQGQSGDIGEMHADQAQQLPSDPNAAMAGGMGMPPGGDPSGGAGGAGGAGGMPPGMSPGQTPMPGGVGVSGAGGGGGIPGVMSPGPTIPPDELRRMLQQ